MTPPDERTNKPAVNTNPLGGEIVESFETGKSSLEGVPPLHQYSSVFWLTVGLIVLYFVFVVLGWIGNANGWPDNGELRESKSFLSHLITIGVGFVAGGYKMRVSRT